MTDDRLSPAALAALDAARQPAPELDTFNKFMVGVRGDKVAMLMPPSEMTAADAIMLAAWLATMAGDYTGEKIKAAMAAVQRS